MSAPILQEIAQGEATLVGGTVTVNDDRIDANSVVLIDMVTPGGGIGAKFVEALTPGTSFDITSTDGTETSTVRWRLMRLVTFG